MGGEPDCDQKEKGIYEKFVVYRHDGKHDTGQKHDGCEYFVLDLTHDRFALPAIARYAIECELMGYHALAHDLQIKVAEMQGRFHKKQGG